MIKSYAYHDYDTASNLLYQFNKFFSAFKMGIDDLPAPTNPAATDISERRNPIGYYKSYYEKYAPLLSGVLGQYQAMMLQHIENERGD